MMHWKGEDVATMHREVLLEIIRQQHYQLEKLEAALREIVLVARTSRTTEYIYKLARAALDKGAGQ